MNGAPQRLQTVPPPTPNEMAKKGVVPFLDPLPRYEMSQPGNILRIFERGGRFRPEVGIPERLKKSPAGRARGLSIRGLGTENRTDPVFIGLQKTRLFDPTLNFLGTNDHAGDYRSSGCTACHVVYANDRSPVHSGPFAKFGNRGTSHSPDPTIPKDEPGHPIEHKFAMAPSHEPVHRLPRASRHQRDEQLPGLHVVGQETDGELMYPASSDTRRPRNTPSRRCPTRRSRRPRPVGAIRQFLANSDGAEPAGPAHAVRRLPRPRLGVPRRVQEGPQGNCSITRATSCPTPTNGQLHGGR